VNVIIVDDESDILDDLKETIQAYEGFVVVGAYTNPMVALEEGQRARPDCAFLDIEMPGLSGIELAERLLAQNPDMEIIFITAFNHFATQAFEVNAMDYILKPVHPERFEKTMERLVKLKGKPPSSIHTEIVIGSLGYFEVKLDGKPIKWTRSKAKELLAYLLHFEGHKKNKYKICEELWPEYGPKKALVNLQTAICALRKCLGAVGREIIRIEFSEESYVLLLGDVRWDVREFLSRYDVAKSTGEIAAANEAISLYQDDYLGNEDWIWSQLASESIAKKYEELLKLVAEKSFGEKRYQETAEIIMKLSQRQAIDGTVQLMLMESAYERNGISGLLQQVNVFRNLFRKEYDMDIDQSVFEYCSGKGVKI